MRIERLSKQGGNKTGLGESGRDAGAHNSIKISHHRTVKKGRSGAFGRGGVINKTTTGSE